MIVGHKWTVHLHERVELTTSLISLREHDAPHWIAPAMREDLQAEMTRAIGEL